MSPTLPTLFVGNVGLCFQKEQILIVDFFLDVVEGQYSEAHIAFQVAWLKLLTNN